jgi:hypothetical protein
LECVAATRRSKLTVIKIDLRALLRVLTITFGLACAGALFGGLAGGVGLAIALFVDPRRWYAGSFESYQLVVCVGAALGTAGAPAVTWVMLRRVPFGRLFALLTLGTLAAAVFGWLAFSAIDMIWGPTLAGFAGFMATAIALSYRYDAPRLSAPRGVAGLISE